MNLPEKKNESPNFGNNAEERPAEEDNQNAAEEKNASLEFNHQHHEKQAHGPTECETDFQFSPFEEEDHCSLNSDHKCDADNEEQLKPILKSKSIAYIANREKGRIEEE